jgi:hypothetical protein
MNLKKGEVWVCKESYCEAEVEVLRAAKSSCHGKFTLRCCCGKDMAPKESLEHAEPQGAPGTHAGRRG